MSSFQGGGTSEKPGNSNVDLKQSRILSLDYMLRRLETRGNGGVPEDNMGNTQLFFLVKEDLRLQYPIEVLIIH